MPCFAGPVVLVMSKKKQLWLLAGLPMPTPKDGLGGARRTGFVDSAASIALPLVGLWSWLQPSPAVPTPRQLPCHRRLSPQAKLDWSQMRTWMLNQTENELASTRAAMGFGL